MAGVTGDVEGSSMGRKGKGERGGPGLKREKGGRTSQRDDLPLI